MQRDAQELMTSLPSDARSLVVSMIDWKYVSSLCRAHADFATWFRRVDMWRSMFKRQLKPFFQRRLKVLDIPTGPNSRLNFLAWCIFREGFYHSFAGYRFKKEHNIHISRGSNFSYAEVAPVGFFVKLNEYLVKYIKSLQPDASVCIHSRTIRVFDFNDKLACATFIVKVIYKLIATGHVYKGVA